LPTVFNASVLNHINMNKFEKNTRKIF